MLFSSFGQKPQEPAEQSIYLQSSPPTLQVKEEKLKLIKQRGSTAAASEHKLGYLQLQVADCSPVLSL